VSIAAGPATVYRNYFAPVTRADGSLQEGQTEDLQINNLADLEEIVGNSPQGRFWENVGGYTLAQDRGLKTLNHTLQKLDREKIKDKLRVGIHCDVQVTSTNWGNNQIRDPDHTCTQVFCSACSVAYSRNGTGPWAQFATLVLEGAYEATLLAALMHALRYPDKPGAKVVYLTAVGGGVFGNDMSWIATALDMACERILPRCVAAGVVLDLRFGSYMPPADRWVDSVVQKYASSITNCEEAEVDLEAPAEDWEGSIQKMSI